MFLGSSGHNITVEELPQPSDQFARLQFSNKMPYFATIRFMQVKGQQPGCLPERFQKGLV